MKKRLENKNNSIYSDRNTNARDRSESWQRKKSVTKPLMSQRETSKRTNRGLEQEI